MPFANVGSSAMWGHWPLAQFPGPAARGRVSRCPGHSGTASGEAGPRARRATRLRPDPWAYGRVCGWTPQGGGCT